MCVHVCLPYVLAWWASLTQWNKMAPFEQGPIRLHTISSPPGGSLTFCPALGRWQMADVTERQGYGAI